MTTAEWKCTRCGATNRKLVTADTTEALDRCVTCRTRHVIRPDPRPAFWQAAAQP
jgi:DNA-directed RNA polymerase subunit RPC12/RpoP